MQQLHAPPQRAAEGGVLRQIGRGLAAFAAWYGHDAGGVYFGLYETFAIDRDDAAGAGQGGRANGGQERN